MTKILAQLILVTILLDAYSLIRKSMMEMHALVITVMSKLELSIMNQLNVMITILAQLILAIQRKDVNTNKLISKNSMTRILTNAKSFFVPLTRESITKQ
jgi:hypothetical protein